MTGPKGPKRPTQILKERLGEPAELAKAAAAFGERLYQQVGRDGNLVFSPYSVFSALSLLRLGARGKSQAELAAALGDLSAPGAYRDLAVSLQVSSPGAFLELANSVWAQRGEPLLPDYLECAARFSAEAREADFQHDPDGACAAINGWVSEKTQGKVPQLLEDLSPDTRLVLASAVYFKGSWCLPFDAALTRCEPFHAAPGRVLPVDMMRQEEELAYAETPEVQAVRLPYVGGALEMLLLLPRRPFDLTACERALRDESLAFETRRVSLYLPRFRHETSLKLVNPLKALGIQLVFDADAADLTGIRARVPDFNLFCSQVVHKAVIEVNEQGAEAAAATAVIGELGVTCAAPPEPAVFRADQPFLFLIRESRSGAVLFLGRVAEPTLSDRPLPPGAAAENKLQELSIGQEKRAVHWVQAMLLKAIAQKAAEARLEPVRDGVLAVHFETDGKRETSGLPWNMHAAVVAQAKCMANLDISERRRPQKGRMRVKAGSRELDIEVETVPGPLGEGLALKFPAL